MRTRDIKTKRIWRRVRPNGYLAHGRFTSISEPNMPNDILEFETVTQADFLREYYPSGHAINDPTIYPDIYREEETDITDNEGNPTGKKRKQIYKELVPRYSFAFQQIIATKQIVHLCGNDIQFELNKEKPTPDEEGNFCLFREGWLKKDMEIAFYEAVKSTKITGDTAIVGYLSNGEFGYKALSYLNGDTLYPHYDSVTGKPSLLARSYFDYDDEGNKVVEWLEVWDDTYLSRFKKTGEKYQTITEKILGIFGFDGYSLISRKEHGFPFLPIAYNRDENGACWSPSQDSCDGYEISFSQLAQNNQAFGFPIMYLQGEETEAMHDINGTIKILTMGPDDKAGFLDKPDAAESFMKQLDTLYKMIYEQSFTVIPPELRSGDLPAAALKILYSPAYEKATTDSAEYQSFLNSLVKLFSYGYGVEVGKTIDFSNLPIKWWIKPYVHVAESAMVADLATAVVNGFCSRQTASEKISMYTTQSEWDRIIREEKKKQEADLLYQLKQKKETPTANPNKE